jgi:hypothetical protein
MSAWPRWWRSGCAGPARPRSLGLAVLAALPVASVKAGTVGAATAAAKGVTAFTGVGVLSVIGSIVSSAVGVLGGLIGLWGRIQNTRSSRERRFVVGTVWGLLAFGLGLGMINRLLFAQHVLRMSTQPADVIAWSVLWLGYLGPLISFSIWRGRQQRPIQIAEGTVEARPNWWMWRLDPAHGGFKTSTHGMLACLVFATCGWLVVSAVQAGDNLLIALILAVCVAGWLWSAAAVLRRPGRTPSVSSAVWWGLGLVNMIVVNLRWDAWFGGASALQFPSHPAPWTVDYLIVFFFATARLGWWLRRRFMALPDAGRAARIAVGVYFGLLLCGLALLAVVK